MAAQTAQLPSPQFVLILSTQSDCVQQPLKLEMVQHHLGLPVMLAATYLGSEVGGQQLLCRV